MHPRIQKPELIHIGQMHERPEHTPEQIEETIKSQLAVARTIKNIFKKNQGPVPVVLEACYSNMGFKEKKRSSFYLKAVFPYGLPENFEQLSDLQKDTLYYFGAVQILFYLDKIPMIYKASHEKIGRGIDEAITREANKHAFHNPLFAMGMMAETKDDYLFKFREEEAISCAKEAAQESHCNKIILVFGDLHKFQHYCGPEGIKYTKISTKSGSPEVANQPKIVEIEEDDIVEIENEHNIAEIEYDIAETKTKLSFAQIKEKFAQEDLDDYMDEIDRLSAIIMSPGSDLTDTANFEAFLEMIAILKDIIFTENHPLKEMNNASTILIYGADALANILKQFNVQSLNKLDLTIEEDLKKINRAVAPWYSLSPLTPTLNIELDRIAKTEIQRWKKPEATEASQALRFANQLSTLKVGEKAEYKSGDYRLQIERVSAYDDVVYTKKGPYVMRFVDEHNKVVDSKDYNGRSDIEWFAKVIKRTKSVYEGLLEVFPREKEMVKLILTEPKPSTTSKDKTQKTPGFHGFYEKPVLSAEEKLERDKARKRVGGKTIATKKSNSP